MENSSPSMPLLGVHVSTSGGAFSAFDRAESLGINTFQIFVKNNKQWFVKALEQAEIEQYHSRRGLWNEAGPIVAHGCYLLNLGSANHEMQEKTFRSYCEELRRADSLGVDHFIFHPGAHLGVGVEEGIKNVAAMLDRIHAETNEVRTTSTLEVTAGQGTSLGASFFELGAMLNAVKHPERVRVCLDTCHMFAAGADVRNAEVWEETWNRFDAEVGFEKLVAIHTNDSKRELGSRVDRHEHIGEGEIGLEGFRLLMNDPRLSIIPKILETPKDDEMREDRINMQRLKDLIGRSVDEVRHMQLELRPMSELMSSATEPTAKPNEGKKKARQSRAISAKGTPSKKR